MRQLLNLSGINNSRKLLVFYNLKIGILVNKIKKKIYLKYNY